METAGNRAACTTAQTSAGSPIEYCQVTTQHQLARVPSVSRDARRARRSGESDKGQKLWRRYQVLGYVAKLDLGLPITVSRVRPHQLIMRQHFCHCVSDITRGACSSLASVERAVSSKRRHVSGRARPVSGCCRCRAARSFRTDVPTRLPTAGSWVNFRDRRNLKILVEDDSRLFNRYSVILVNPARHPQVKADICAWRSSIGSLRYRWAPMAVPPNSVGPSLIIHHFDP